MASLTRLPTAGVVGISSIFTSETKPRLSSYPDTLSPVSLDGICEQMSNDFFVRTAYALP
jgi:hypothetical protein